MTPAQSGTAPHGLIGDVDEIGLSARLVLSLPLLRTLIQAVAESEGDWNYLNVKLGSGPWIGVARRWWEDFLIVSTNHGDCTPVPYPEPLDRALVSHRFEFVTAHQGYRQFVRFDSDKAFEDIALLMIGTFQHAWRATGGDYLAFDLNLSTPPPPDRAVH